MSIEAGKLEWEERHRTYTPTALKTKPRIVVTCDNLHRKHWLLCSRPGLEKQYSREDALQRNKFLYERNVLPNIITTFTYNKLIFLYLTHLSNEFPPQSLWLSVLVLIAVLRTNSITEHLLWKWWIEGRDPRKLFQTFNFHFPPWIFSQHQSNAELIPDRGRDDGIFKQLKKYLRTFVCFTKLLSILGQGIV